MMSNCGPSGAFPFPCPRVELSEGLLTPVKLVSLRDDLAGPKLSSDEDEEKAIVEWI